MEPLLEKADASSSMIGRHKNKDKVAMSSEMGELFTLSAKAFFEMMEDIQNTGH